MIKKIVIASFLFGMMAVAIVQAVEKEEPKSDYLPGLNVGLIAPDFELKTLDGETVRLTDYRGKKVILNFWATWCPPCKEEMPAMQKFHKEADDKIVILAVNIDPEYDVAGFAKKMEIQFPILLDDQDEVNNSYKILTIPTTFFINEKGEITHKHLGAMTIDMMKKYSK